jgi:hypothetical protein
VGGWFAAVLEVNRMGGRYYCIILHESLYLNVRLRAASTRMIGFFFGKTALPAPGRPIHRNIDK